ncbi:decaprenyl-phosphate phosphoribosyltransferase [Geodermatophilus sp. SYSU D00710]
MDVEDHRLVQHASGVSFTRNLAADVREAGGGASPQAAVVTRTARSIAAGLGRTMRPRQWVKNLLVFAAPLASGTVFRLDVLAATVLAFALFCAAASGLYLLNDVRDAEADRRHPVKRHRAVARGVVPVRVAVVAGVVLLTAALGTAAVLARPALTAVLGAYVAISLAYSLALKDQPVVDLACVASGFVLRGVAGGAAAGIALSQWFILVSAFGALFMVAGKRYAELLAVGERSDTRRSLREYSASYLRFVWSLSAGVACTTYGLWAFEMRSDSSIPWTTISVAPFVLALLRYAVDVDRGSTGAPEEVVLRDRGLLLLGVVWAVTVCLGVLTG